MTIKVKSASALGAAVIALGLALGLDVSAEESAAIAAGVGALAAVVLRNWPAPKPPEAKP